MTRTWPRRRVKYLLVEVGLITVGLLLTLSVDKLVEWREHQSLVAQARESLRNEISNNVATLDRALGKIDALLKEVQTVLRALRAAQRAPEGAADEPHLNFDYHSMQLSDTSWQTTQATQALNYMPYNEAEAYSVIYSIQASVAHSERVLTEDFAQLIGLLNLAAADTSKLTVSGAATLARTIGVACGHLLELKGNVLGAASAQHSFLDRRSLDAEISVGADICLE
jgi:hypothetical protein